MSNEYKDWMRENVQDAKRVVALLEDAIVVLEDLCGFECSDSISTQLLVSKHALLKEIAEASK